jgi:hypothetical protein
VATLSPSDTAPINSKVVTGKRIAVSQSRWIGEVASYATVTACARNDGAAYQGVKERTDVARRRQWRHGGKR